MSLVVLLAECGESLLALSERIRRFQLAVVDLAKDPNITQEMIMKEEVKLDAAWKRVDSVMKAMTNFPRMMFKVDYAAASDEQKVESDACREKVKKLLFDMGQDSRCVATSFR